MIGGEYVWLVARVYSHRGSALLELKTPLGLPPHGLPPPQMHGLPMLTESRKRRHSCDADEEQLLPRAKRFPGHPFFSELAHDVWDSESSSSDSSCVSSPEKPTGTSSMHQSAEQNGKCVLDDSCSPSTSAQFGKEAAFLLCKSEDSYHHMNRILREAHFSSLKTRGQTGAT